MKQKLFVVGFENYKQKNIKIKVDQEILSLVELSFLFGLIFLIHYLSAVCY